MPMNDAAAPGHVCPGIRIHAADIVQPPGIGISPIADIDAHQTTVTAAAAAKSSAEMPKKGSLRSSPGRHAGPDPAGEGTLVVVAGEYRVSHGVGREHVA
jgi:hypothetical protein